MEKEEQYKSLFHQVESLLEGETDLISKMSNVSSMIHPTFGFWWTGFYRVCGNELILSPFQGQSHVCISLTERVSAEQRGNKPRLS